MTIEDFNNNYWSGTSKVIYKTNEYEVEAVDFEEKLIAINEFPDLEDEGNNLSWKRCENCKLVY